MLIQSQNAVRCQMFYFDEISDREQGHKPFTVGRHVQ